MLKKIAASAPALVLALALAVPAFAQGPQTPGMDKRETNMEKRIEQGKAVGALNDKEAARMERRKARLEKAEERAKADGTVTPEERARLNKRADRLSKDIYREKHDKQTEAPKQ